MRVGKGIEVDERDYEHDYEYEHMYTFEYDFIRFQYVHLSLCRQVREIRDSRW